MLKLFQNTTLQQMSGVAVDYEEGSSTASFQGYDVGIYNAYLSSDSTINHANRLRSSIHLVNHSTVERTRFTGAIGIGSTEITFGDDFNTLKSAPGDTIKSLNGTYSGTIVSYTTTGGGQQ